MQQRDFTDIADYPIFERWAASSPDKIQLFSYPTPNGVKVSIALEELGLDYEPHLVTLAEEDVKSEDFLSLNPNNKIPAIIDPNGPEGQPVGLFESGAILVYLAEKSGKLLGSNSMQKAKIIQWLMFQMGGIGPMFGQLGYFNVYGGKDIEDPRPRKRYIQEAKRLLNVLEEQLQGREWVAGAFSIADIAIVPWLQTLATLYEADEITELNRFTRVVDYMERFSLRPAVQRGWKIPARD